MTSTTPNQPQFLEHACDATRILNKRRQLFDIKERHEHEKKEYDAKCKVVEEKNKEITKRDLEFQAKVVRAEFAKDSKAKQEKLAQRYYYYTRSILSSCSYIVHTRTDHRLHTTLSH